MVTSLEEAHVDNPILLDYLTSKVILEEPEIRCTVPTILIENNCMHGKLHFRMPGSSRDYNYQGDKSDERNGIPTTSRPQCVTTQLQRFHQETSDVDWYVGADADYADADEEVQAWQADDRSIQNQED